MAYKSRAPRGTVVELPTREPATRSLVDPATRSVLLDVFTAMDVNQRGALDQKEIGRLLNKLLGRNVDEMTCGEIVAEVCNSDSASATIDFETFCAAIAPLLSSFSEAEITKRAFAVMDADGSGCISATELKPLMSAVAGTKLTMEAAEEILKFSAGADGTVRYADYVKVTSK